MGTVTGPASEGSLGTVTGPESEGSLGAVLGGVASDGHCLCGSGVKHLMVDLGPELGSRSSGQENERAVK